MTAFQRAWLGLGSNIGDKAGNIAEAITKLEAKNHVRVIARSRLYRTAPWGNEAQDWFVNACIAIDTRLSPQDLLDLCLDTEKAMGRERLEKWGPRLIDIDLLSYEKEATETERLSLPHPLILQRAFVLAPLADIAPELVIDGVTVSDALRALDAHDVVPLD